MFSTFSMFLISGFGRLWGYLVSTDDSADLGKYRIFKTVLPLQNELVRFGICRNPPNHQSTQHSLKVSRTRKFEKLSEMKEMSYPLSRLPPYWWLRQLSIAKPIIDGLHQLWIVLVHICDSVPSEKCSRLDFCSDHTRADI